MSQDYLDNYLQAINNPLPELQETFKEELELLKRHCNENSVILDVGCGVGRPADALILLVKKVFCVDNDKKVLALAQERCRNLENVETREEDALRLSFTTDSFDVVYATYNLIGSLEEAERLDLVNEMQRVAKKDSKVINITWKDDETTTEFLKKYYPSIGIDILLIDGTKTVTSKGTFARISKETLLEYYKAANLKDIHFADVGPVWVAVIGTK